MGRFIAALFLATLGVAGMARSDTRGGLLDMPVPTPQAQSKALPQEMQGAEFDALMKRIDDGDPKAWDDYYEFARRAKERKAQQPVLKLPN